jgi:predicted dehydrogenase
MEHTPDSRARRHLGGGLVSLEPMNTNKEQTDLNRRDFIKGSSLTTLMALMGGVALKAGDQTKPADNASADPPPGSVKCAVIGCGIWGRELLKTLARLPVAEVVAVCETYEPFLRRAAESAPKAAKYDDYRNVLADQGIQAVFIATPSHQHREIALAALHAGKHVYCEAPLAASLEDARAIALAARGAFKQNFQAGQQSRSDPQMHFLLGFIRTGAMGNNIKARAQWQKKQSWRRTATNPEREKEINWRLRNESSAGLIGEIGLHQLDIASWVLTSSPVAVTGFGSLAHWKDGRDVPDTIQAVFEYPNNVRLLYDATLTNSFDGEYQIFYGTDAALMIRDNQAWLFKEVDSPMLGWEVYARKDSFYKETGIALVADSTKLTAKREGAAAQAPPDEKTPVYFALEAFLKNSKTIQTGVEDFTANFDASDTTALKDYLTGLNKNMLPAAGYKEGFEAAVTAIKANEAILKRQRITYQKEWFQLA